MASSLKKVHFWNPICRTPSALWNGPSPISLSFLFWSRWDLVSQNNLGSPWLVPNLIKIRKELAKICYFAFYSIDCTFIVEEISLFWTFHFRIQYSWGKTQKKFHGWLDGWLEVPTEQVWPHKKPLIFGEKMLRLLEFFGGKNSSPIFSELAEELGPAILLYFW